MRGSHERGGPQGIGSCCTTTRLLGGRERTSTQEVIALDPPHRWSVQGVDGPVRADVDVLVESIEDGAAARVTITLNFRGRGIGRVIVPLLVIRQAAREAPRSCAKLKQLLEQGE